jgi:hypothetical protein
MDGDINHMKLQLNIREKNTVEQATREHIEYLQAISAKVGSEADLTEDELLTLDGLLSGEFARVGLGDDDEPTDYGTSLDEIVGRIAQISSEARESEN